MVVFLKSYKFLFELVKSASNCLFLMLFLVLKHFSNTGGPQIVLFLRSQGTVLLKKPYYSGTYLVLKPQFMTFGFSKSPFLAHFQITLIFETKKVIIWFHFETFFELFITNSDIFTRF